MDFFKVASGWQNQDSTQVIWPYWQSVHFPQDKTCTTSENDEVNLKY